MPLEGAERRWGAAYLVIHRADLQRALVEAVHERSDVKLTLGAEVVGFEIDRDLVSVGLVCGQTQTRDEADLLIGADGLRSHVRGRLSFGAQDRATFATRVAYRAIVNTDDVSPLSTENIVLRLGKEAHLVHYTLRGGSIINLVATIGSPSPTGGTDSEQDEEVNRSSLARAFTGWSKEARLLMKAPVRWRAWPLYHRPPISTFSLGRVALVGDAAHPMVPFLAQGAAQAIEDASALGRILAQAKDVPSGLSMYSRNRVARTSRVQREALKLGRIYHMSGPLAFARDATIRLLGTRSLIERYDWLYSA